METDRKKVTTEGEAECENVPVAERMSKREAERDWEWLSPVVSRLRLEEAGNNCVRTMKKQESSSC